MGAAASDRGQGNPGPHAAAPDREPSTLAAVRKRYLRPEVVVSRLAAVVRSGGSGAPDSKVTNLPNS
jgi:hypothetical protein